MVDDGKEIASIPDESCTEASAASGTSSVAIPERGSKDSTGCCENWVHWSSRLFWLIPLAFYWTTASRVPGWIDAPMIASNVHLLVTGTWVNIHNLFHILGRVWTLLIPWGDLHYRLNLLCGVFGAITVHFVFVNGLKMTRNPVAALLGAIAVMLGHSLWWHSTILEVYTLNTALLGILLYYILRYQESDQLIDLYKAVFVFGLGLFNHVLMGLFGFGFVILALHPSQWRKIFRAGTLLRIFLFFGLALQIFLFIFLREFNDHLLKLGGQTFHDQWLILKDMLDGMTGGRFKDFMFPTYLTSEQKWHWHLNYLFLLLINYPSVAFLTGIVGFFLLMRRKDLRMFSGFFLTGFVIQAVWSSNYMIWDTYAFGLPVWIMFGSLTPLGFAYFLNRGKQWRRATLILSCTLLIGPYVYSQVAKWDKENGFWREYFSFYDYVSNLWDASLYFGNPNKMNYTITKEIAETFFQKIPVGAHICDDDGKGQYPFSLYYQKVLKRRTDIHFHSLFGPELNTEVARRFATELFELLKQGEQVFISSPYWPERPVLNEMYARFSLPQQVAVEQVNDMSLEELERTFPKYALVRVPLSQDGRFYIYEFQRRGEASRQVIMLKDWVVEGESMGVMNSEGGNYFPQALNGWSGGSHLLWLDAREGSSLDLQFFVPREMNADLLIRYTTSYDFGRFQLALDGAKIGTEFEGYSRDTSRSEEISLGRHRLVSGNHTLRITIKGSSEDADQRNGFGLDYLRIKGDE
ncbi:membrane hypothetical protein [Gammaproteobacteria bacterium]